MGRQRSPQLEGDALKATQHRGGPIQIIASAGAGKTEVVSQRIATLMEAGEAPDTIVAFTFTEKAAKELKRRTELRVEERMGKSFVDKLNGCYIGTIHAYCYELLRKHVTKYESYDLLDDNRLAAFLTRERQRIELGALGERLYTNIKDFVRNIQVVENELIPVDELSSPFRDVVERYLNQLNAYRLLTFGSLINLAVEALDNAEVFQGVQSKLRHLIVDEYQDINPAQEALISKLVGPKVELCVVGDDDQSIYQWRGSDVTNIVEFDRRYDGVSTFKLMINRRSRPSIIKAANGFAQSIRGRLQKSMEQHREEAKPETVTWKATTEADEARQIAQTIVRLQKEGYRYRDIGVLVRSSTSYPKLLDAFSEYNIPVQPGGRTGLFKEPDAQVFGQTFAYLAGHEWRSERYGRGSHVTLDSLIKEYTRIFRLDQRQVSAVHRRLEQWKNEVKNPTGSADLIGSYYDLLGDCGIANWDLHDPSFVARLGNLARCSAILTDYESIRRRARPDDQAPGEVIGGMDRGDRYYFWLATHIQNWAQGEFEGFEGEDDFTLDAVDLTTVHKAKGLEWPVVFVPCVSANRFPSSNTGKKQNWLVPDEAFDRFRYEGTENDERRLFYVAVTRARDWLSVSTHDSPNKRPVAPSQFLLEFSGGDLDYMDELPLPPPIVHVDTTEDLLAITFSELANYKTCALAYRLRHLLGFQPSLAPELGYGKAVHHIMRSVAEFTRRHQRPPSPDQLNLIFDEEFYLPAANKPGHAQMRQSAMKLVNSFIQNHSDDLERVWAIEWPFELHLPNAVVTGRADVILDGEDETSPSSLAIVDYKTATNENLDYDWQLQIYADAGCREGLDVRAAYVHDLKAAKRETVDIRPTALKQAEDNVISLVDRLKAREFNPSPGQACKKCDVRSLCKHALKTA